MNSTPSTRSTHTIKAVMWLAALLIGPACHAASFDCALASSRIDNAICASPKVSKLDSDLEPVYLAVLANTSNPDSVKTAQRAWLQTTRNQCQDEECFVTVYQQRIAALSAVAPKSFLEAKANVEAEDSAENSLAAENAATAAAEAQKVAEQAAAAASAAQAQKVAEQVAAAASATKAKEVEEKEVADARRNADQQGEFLIAAGAAAICVVVALFGWFWLRRRGEFVKRLTAPAAPARESAPVVVTAQNPSTIAKQSYLPEAGRATHGNIGTVPDDPKRPEELVAATSTKGSASKFWGKLTTWQKAISISVLFLSLISVGLIGAKLSRPTESVVEYVQRTLTPKEQMEACSIFMTAAYEVVGAKVGGSGTREIRNRYDGLLAITSKPVEISEYVNLLLDGVERKFDSVLKLYKSGEKNAFYAVMYQGCMGPSKTSAQSRTEHVVDQDRSSSASGYQPKQTIKLRTPDTDWYCNFGANMMLERTQFWISQSSRDSAYAETNLLTMKNQMKNVASNWDNALQLMELWSTFIKEVDDSRVEHVRNYQTYGGGAYQAHWKAECMKQASKAVLGGK